MKIHELVTIPSWDWPEDAADRILRLAGDPAAPVVDRLIAVELAGDTTVVNDELCRALLDIVKDPKQPERLRSKAAIALGPVLEEMSIAEIDDDDDPPITEATVEEIQRVLRGTYAATDTPKEVRRRALEASVRGDQTWHGDAIRAQFESSDREWRLTAVFCMRFVKGFDTQILEALSSSDDEILKEAVDAAGNWAVAAGFERVSALLNDHTTEKEILLSAIDAVASMRPAEAPELLLDLTTSDDEDIAEAADEAIEMASGLSGLADLEGDEDD